MTKWFFGILVFSIWLVNCVAADTLDDSVQSKWCLAGGLSYCSDGRGSFGEVGFPLFRNGWAVDDYLDFNALYFSGSLTGLVYSISDKLTAGGYSVNNLFRSYGFIETGIVVGPSFPLSPLMGGGGGFETYFSSSLGMYLESGYDAYPFQNSSLYGNQFLRVGWRGYL